MTGLAHLAGGADRFAIVDTETTGVYASDRIVEVAIITLGLDGEVHERWETLVQPERGMSAEFIHGISAAMVADAPSWAEISGDVALRLDGACLVAHNVAFDVRMLRSEYQRLGGELIAPRSVDTLRATGARLSVACEHYGISLDGAHRASADAWACARLLEAVADYCDEGAPTTVTTAPPYGQVLRREDTVRVQLPKPPFIWTLVSRLDFDGLEVNLLAYLELVERVTVDLRVTPEERGELLGLANDLGLNDAQVLLAHRRFLNDLIDVALDDDELTSDEYEQVLRVASCLGLDPDHVHQRTRAYRAGRTEARPLEPGTEVVFTGDDPMRPRDELKAHAALLGLRLAPSGLRKETGLLVAYDVDSRSGKAKKAALYNVPILSTEQFAALRPGDSVEMITASDDLAARKVVTCPICHATWTVSALAGTHSSRPCGDCQPSKRERSFGTGGGATAEPRLETLVCQECGSSWERQTARGRKPKLCPNCVVQG